jgi:hypothetical protein
MIEIPPLLPIVKDHIGLRQHRRLSNMILKRKGND